MTLGRAAAAFGDACGEEPSDRGLPVVPLGSACPVSPGNTPSGFSTGFVEVTDVSGDVDRGIFLGGFAIELLR
jgi:hypothetical protein